MENIINDIQQLNEVKTFLLKATLSNDQADAELGVALDKLSTIIITKENIITDFEQRECQDE